MTLAGLLDLLSVWMFQFSKILHFLLFIPEPHEKSFQHVEMLMFGKHFRHYCSFLICISNSSGTWGCFFHTTAAIN